MHNKFSNFIIMIILPINFLHKICHISTCKTSAGQIQKKIYFYIFSLSRLLIAQILSDIWVSNISFSFTQRISSSNFLYAASVWTATNGRSFFRVSTRFAWSRAWSVSRFFEISNRVKEIAQSSISKFLRHLTTLIISI